MYLKLSAINEEFQLRFLDENGLEINPNHSVSISLYNKVGTSYQLIQTETKSNFEYLNKNLTDKKSVFVDIVLNGVVQKTKVKVEVITTEVRMRYKVSYETTYPFRKLSTTFLRRVSLGMPSWSSAHKNDVSNFSKIFYPLYLIPERIYYKTKEALNINLSNSTQTRRIETRGTTSLVLKEDGSVVPRTFIKEKEMINSVSTERIDQKNINLFSVIEDGTVVYPIKMDNTFNNLFVKSDKTCVVHITGINKRRLPINEYIFCDGVVFTKSFLQYKEITSVSVVKIAGYEDPKLELTNYMDLRKYQNNFRTNTSTGMPDDSKDFEVPLYMYEPETYTLKTFFAKQWLQEEDGSVEYFIPNLDKNNGFFVTEDEDIIAISPRVSLGTEENHDEILNEINQKILTEVELYKVYTGLLRRNLEVDLELHSSNNNNSFVTILDESSAASTGEVEVQILTREIIENYGNVSVKISVNVDGVVYYLDDSNNWVEEPVFKFINNSNPIYVNQNVVDSTYFSVVMEFNGVKYQASHIRNRINLVPNDIYVKAAYHNGDDIIVQTENGLEKLILQKDYYEFVNDNSIQYSNYNSDMTILDEKGHKDGDYISR